MSETSDALRRVMAQVGANTDVLVGGTPVLARQVMAEAAAALGVDSTVVSVASPIGELSLSTLIAQLSGRLDFDDQDDAVLELGFKRLSGEGQTVLTVLAPMGISRSALRYLQHVSRQAPRLVMVVYLAPSLQPMLEEPGFAALRARLLAAPAIGLDAPASVVIAQAVALVPPVVEPVAPPLAAYSAALTAPVAARARRPVLWLASALSAAAVAGVVWAVHSAPGTAVAGSRTAHADFPVTAALVSPPALAGSSDPVAAAMSAPELAITPPSVMARPPRAALASLPAPPPSMPLPLPLPHPEANVASLVQPPSRPALRRPDPTRRDPTRFARARPYWTAPRNQEPAEYDGPPGWDGVSPIWVRRDPRRGDTPYLGTYAVGPNGVRVFQYDP